jgi:hypothetical protein
LDTRGETNRPNGGDTLPELKGTDEVEVDITPDKSLMEKIGHVGFAPERALAELIDNALDARQDEDTGKIIIPGKITVKISIEENKISIEDSASGIKRPEECLRPASSLKQEMLGSFGLGLKTASMSLGKKLIIDTKFIDQKERHVVIFDLDQWYTTKEWKIKIQRFGAPDEKSHGTKLTIEKLWVDPRLYDLTKIRKELAFRFSEFVSNKELEIIVNGKKCIPEPLNLMPQQEFEMIVQELKLSDDFSKRENFEFEIEGLHIEGWVDLLAKWSYSDGRFGFNLYRGKRLLDPFQKIGIREHPNHSRIFGHIYLPLKAPVKFTKDGVEIGRGWYVLLVQKIKELSKKHIDLCEKIAKKRRFFDIKPQTLKQITDYLSKIEEAFKRSSLIKQLLETPERRIRSKEEEAEGLGSVTAEKRGPKVHATFKKPVPKGERVRQPGKRKQSKNWFYVTIRGRKIKITHDLQYIEEDPVKMYYRYYDEGKNEFQVITNTHFDSWGLTKDESFYAAMNIIQALSEFVYSEAENPQFTMEDIREDLWRLVGKVAYENL